MSKPIDKLVEGRVHISIFENQGVKGEFRAATVQLRYKNKDGEYQDGTSYGATDLLNLEKAAHEARERILAAKKVADKKHAA